MFVLNVKISCRVISRCCSSEFIKNVFNDALVKSRCFLVAACVLKLVAACVRLVAACVLEIRSRQAAIGSTVPLNPLTAKEMSLEQGRDHRVRNGAASRSVAVCCKTD